MGEDGSSDVPYIAMFMGQGSDEVNAAMGNIMAIILDDTGAPKADIDVQIIDHPMVEDLAAMSDQQNYWHFDIPALMINDTSFLRNPHYHQTSDDIETLSFEHMQQVVTCTYNALVNL